MNIKYCGPIKDYSGYGEASRHHLAALDAAGVNVVVQIVNYTMETADFGSLGALTQKMMDNRGEYKIKLLHTTPDEYERLIEPGKYHIGLFYWETDRLPDVYVRGLEMVDEIWTGSVANEAALVNSGVTKPIYIFPQAIETEREEAKPYEIHDFDGYLFYSIFEWTDRKNPKALLKAYYEAFPNGENVGLLIKTYFRNFTLQNKRLIRAHIDSIKSELGLSSYPPVYLYMDLMDRSQINRIHATGDCFVSANRGEGWGIPQVEAALAGNPVITTGYGGASEYFTDSKNAVLLPYTMVNVRGMEHASHLYTSVQKWAEVNQPILKGSMKWAYAAPNLAKQVGEAGSKFVKKAFNFKQVGLLMNNRLTKLEGEL